MAGFEDTRQKIISTLMGRPNGTEIQPENHQDYALNMLDYIRSLELIATSTLIGVAESNTTPVQPNSSRVCYIAGVAQNQTVTFENFIGENGNPISVTTGDMEGIFIILMWNTQYWSAQTFSTNIISQTESATFYYRYNIRKTYASIALMNADVASPIGTDGKYIKVGDIVTVVNSTTPSENGIYSYEGATDGWKYQSSFNFQLEQIRSQNTNTAPSSKLFDDELSELEKKSSNKGLLQPNFTQGNFVGDSFVAEAFALNSGYINMPYIGSKIRVNVNEGYGAVIWIGDEPETSSTFTMVSNGIDSSGIQSDGFEMIITKKCAVFVLVKNPLSASDILSDSDVLLADLTIDVTANLYDVMTKNIAPPVRTINKFGSLVEKHIYKYHINSLILAQHKFNDNSGVYFSAGGVYTDCFLSDLSFPLAANPEFYTLEDINNIIEKFIKKRDSATNMLPMAINAYGEVAAMYSGSDYYHYRPIGESTMFVPVILFDIFERYGNTDIFEQYKEIIASGLASIPVDATTNLVNIEFGSEWVPWGFQEISRFIGNVCTASAFLYNAYVHMSKLYTAIGDEDNATVYSNKANAIKSSLQSDSNLWDSETGMYNAATVQNEQIDIYGSALCVSLDIASTAQKTAISNYLYTNFDDLTFNTGYIRQSNTAWAITGWIPSDGSTNYINSYADGFYQNGIWTVANYYVLTALAYAHQDKAIIFATDILTNDDPSIEWQGIPPYSATPSPTDNPNQIMATSGTLRWVRENSFLF